MRQLGLKLAERTGDHRRRTAAIEIRSFPDAKLNHDLLQLRERHPLTVVTVLNRNEHDFRPVFGIADCRSRPISGWADAADIAGKGGSLTLIDKNRMSAYQHLQGRRVYLLA
ncbi:hypothetical protein D3C84_999120 [compost metagenome]